MGRARRLLEEENLLFDAVSGASAGAVNAVLLVSGLADGGRMGAKNRLEGFWKKASEAAPQIQPGIAAAIATRILPIPVQPFQPQSASLASRQRNRLQWSEGQPKAYAF